jgi:hypothetical protein
MVWASKLQQEVALSTTEAEYNALSESLPEVISLMQLLTRRNKGKATLDHSSATTDGPLQGLRRQQQRLGDGQHAKDETKNQAQLRPYASFPGACLKGCHQHPQDPIVVPASRYCNEATASSAVRGAARIAIAVAG